MSGPSTSTTRTSRTRRSPRRSRSSSPGNSRRAREATMPLADVIKAFTQALAPAASRDALVLERDGLLAAPPPAPASTLSLLEAPACRCETCVRDFHEAQTAHLKAAAWAGRAHDDGARDAAQEEA